MHADEWPLRSPVRFTVSRLPTDENESIMRSRLMQALPQHIGLGAFRLRPGDSVAAVTFIAPGILARQMLTSEVVTAWDDAGFGFWVLPVAAWEQDIDGAGHPDDVVEWMEARLK